MNVRTVVFVMGCATVALSGQGRPPIVGVSHVAVQTSDLAKARDFYAGLLGYPEVPLAGHPDTAVFAVKDRQRLIVHDRLPADRDERLLDVAFETANVEALREFLKHEA